MRGNGAGCRLAGWLVGWLRAGWLAAGLTDWLASWLACWLAGWLAEGCQWGVAVARQVWPAGGLPEMLVGNGCASVRTSVLPVTQVEC